jgi:hypothetical protein
LLGPSCAFAPNDRAKTHQFGDFCSKLLPRPDSPRRSSQS